MMMKNPHSDSVARFARGPFAAPVVARLIAGILAFTGLCRADPDSALRAIDLTLRAMEHAVLAGDRDGYLRHVCPRDGVFMAEQKHWADDLKTHAPEAFTLAIDPETFRLSDGSAVANLTMSWQMPVARPRSVSYDVIFTDHDGVWRYAGERWNILKGEGVEVRFADGFEETARRAAEVFPEVRAHVEEGFEITIDRVQQVKLYPTMPHLQASIYLSYTDPLSGWNEPGESVKILLGRRASTGALKVLLAHEFGHVCTFEMGDKAAKMPWWVAEGVAELAAEAFGTGGGLDRSVRRWAQTGRLADFADMTDFRTTPSSLHMHVYRQGHHMMAYISDRFGRTNRNNWVRALTQGRTLDEASREVLNVSFDDLDAQWRASLVEAPSPQGADAP